MARLTILVSFFAAGAFAKRIATKHVQLQSQAVADGHGILPGSMHPALPLRLGGNPRGSVPVGISTQEAGNLRPAARPRASVPVGMSTQEAGNLRKYPADLRAPGWINGLNPSRHVFRMSADDYQDEATEPDAAPPVELTPEEVVAGWMNGLAPSRQVFRLSLLDDDQIAATTPDAAQIVELTPEEVAAAEAKKSEGGRRRRSSLKKLLPEQAAAVAAEKEEKFELNVRETYDSLGRDIPRVLQFRSKSLGFLWWRKTPINWDIYADDLETDLENVGVPGVRLIATMAPSMFSGGKDLHKAALQELRMFIGTFCRYVVVKTTEKTMKREELYNALSGFEGDQVISFSWQAEFTMNSFYQQQQNNSDRGGGVAPKAITIYAESWLHLDDEGKIYRHTINKLHMHFNPEDAELSLAVLRGGVASPQ